jgi:hypothetical protein
LTGNDFVHLSQLIREAFPSEIPETYYVRGRNGGNATGKLRSQYLNIRTELGKVCLITRKSRSRPVEVSTTVEILEEEADEIIGSLQLEDSGELEDLKDRWTTTREKRLEICREQGSEVYFKKFPFLSSGAGYLLVSLKILKLLKIAKFLY